MGHEKRATDPGLGESPRRHDSFLRSRVESPQVPTIPPPPSFPGVRRDTRPFESQPPPRPSWAPEAASATARRPSILPPTERRPRASRPPVRVDDVGQAAVRLARGPEERAPRLKASDRMIAQAPIDSRTAFLLSMIDGQNTVETLADVTGMARDEVSALLERLTRLGLIEIP
jgi:hypothetical protein